MSVLWSIPSLTDDKGLTKEPVWFLFFCGRDDMRDCMKIELMFGWRRDLVHPRFDRGRVIPVALGVQFAWGNRLNPTIRVRCDVNEIARRLAGGDE